MLSFKGSIGADLHHLEDDRNIKTNADENRRRRTIQLVRTSPSWGFTLQTYGIRHKKSNEIDVMTYVDYIEMSSPAFMAGMRKGDVILSVNGESTESFSHSDLVKCIKACDNTMRLVVLFEDCCSKVELHDRFIKLKKVLSEKIMQLRQLEEVERQILEPKGLYRDATARMSMRSTASSLDSSYDRYSIIMSPNGLHAQQRKGSSPTSVTSNEVGIQSSTNIDMEDDELFFGNDSDSGTSVTCSSTGSMTAGMIIDSESTPTPAICDDTDASYSTLHQDSENNESAIELSQGLVEEFLDAMELSEGSVRGLSRFDTELYINKEDAITRL